MNEAQFRGEDSDLAKNLTEDSEGLVETRVVIYRFREFLEVNHNNQNAGIVPSRNKYLIETSMMVRELTGKDIVLNAGLYAVGDIMATSRIPVFPADGRLNLEADKLLYFGRIFTLRGKPWAVPMAGGNVIWKHVWRLAE